MKIYSSPTNQPPTYLAKKKENRKGKKEPKERILQAAQRPFNDLQKHSENPSSRNTRRLLYKLPLRA